MTRINKIKELNIEIQKMEITKDLGFFQKILPDKISQLLPLLEVETENEKLKTELEFEKTVFIKGAISFSKESKFNETQWEKEFTLRKCKELVNKVIVHILFACNSLGQNHVLAEDKF